MENKLLEKVMLEKDSPMKATSIFPLDMEKKVAKDETEKRPYVKGERKSTSICKI